MRKYRWAIIRLSQRFVRVEVNGSVFWVMRPQTCGFEPINGPFRRHDKRFRLLPKGWEP